ATGRELIEALLLAATDRGVRFIEDAFVEHLLVKDGCCYGLIYSKEGKLRSFSTGVVILAAGGCGQLFQYTTNAPAVTGDGLALAYRAGAVLRDLEFFQFHPTVFLPPQGQPFLISEAVRGEGAYLVNSDGERFMERYHERAELGPRDIVSRAIVAECRQTGGQVYLDLRHLGADFVAGRFPTIHKRCLEWGLDVTRQLVPVTPAAHYLIGGIAVDLDGHTAVKNLFGVGEIASTGVHGANRLASNSLLEGLVFGHRVAEAAVKANSFIGNINGRQFLDVDFIRPTAAAEKTCAGLRPRLQQLMWEKVGLIRSEEGLLAMKKQLMEWLPLLAFQYYQPELLENRNMLLGACMMTEASLLRRESRGCHYRDDYPNYDHNMSGRHISFQLTDHTVVQSADYPRAFIHSGPA
ncbi:MAG TPA: FAD-binding protein, partial [Candidatus Limnocylindrales bacterium]|nr:FAD-binding protein [Candidatus Limnocylindrales bacterium]